MSGGPLCHCLRRNTGQRLRADTFHSSLGLPPNEELGMMAKAVLETTRLSAGLSPGRLVAFSKQSDKKITNYSLEFD